MKTPAGLALKFKRIDAAVKRAQQRAAKPRRPSAAELLAKAKAAGLKPKN